MAGIVPELTHGVQCPGRGSFCPGNMEIDHRAWIYARVVTVSTENKIEIVAESDSESSEKLNK